MAYSELIKNFSRIREYMRQFYVYGFKSRSDFDEKSARGYDNEKRRIESWLGEYMSFRQEPSGKKIFLSMDGKDITHNPLYQAFKAKSFTANDIMLHFYLLDILEDGSFSAGDIADIIANRYLTIFDESTMIDESTIRKKLKEYENLGLIESHKSGKKIIYSKSSSSVDLDAWQDALAFFSEEDPVGVIGSYLLPSEKEDDEYLIFRHHDLLQALDAEVLCQLLAAISDDKTVLLQVHTKRGGISHHHVCPIKILVSVQTGRRYLMAYTFIGGRIDMFRLDHIEEVDIQDPAEDKARMIQLADHMESHMWGASLGDRRRLDHVEMILQIEEGSGHILNRLYREKRKGKVEQIDHLRYKFSVDCYDAWELVPWMRSFFGRIISVSSTNKEVESAFVHDMEAMAALYGGDEDVV